MSIDTKIENKVEEVLISEVDRKLAEMLQGEYREQINQAIVHALKDYHEENAPLKEQLAYHDSVLIRYEDRLEKTELKVRTKILLVDGIEPKKGITLKSRVCQVLNKEMKRWRMNLSMHSFITTMKKVENIQPFKLYSNLLKGKGRS